MLLTNGAKDALAVSRIPMAEQGRQTGVVNE